MTWVLCALVLPSACADGPGASGWTDGAATEASDPSLRFDGATSTLDGLGRRVLESLASGDTAGLASLRLTEQEHNQIVWPEFPASRAEVGFPVDYAWTNIELRDRRSVSRLVPMFNGLRPVFRTVQCRGATQVFETFEVRTDCWTLFELEGRDGTFEAQLFKDVLVRGGGHKIFRFYDEPPRLHDPARVE